MADAVIETLSDVIAELSILVVRHKKENSAPPATLLNGVKAVGACAQKLKEITESLAKNEYEDFPVIAEELLVGAQEVVSGSKELEDSVEQLKKSDKGQLESAWDGVGRGIYLMADNTTILLQIVYGAETQRLFAAAARAAAAAEALGTHVARLGDDPTEEETDRLMEEAKRAGAAAKALADAANSASGPAGNPETRKQLQEAAKNILDKANDALRKTAAFASDPNAPGKEAVKNAAAALAKEAGKLAPSTADGLASWIGPIERAVQEESSRRREFKKAAPPAPGPDKRYKIVRPTQFDLPEDAPFQWPRLRHVEGNPKTSPGSSRPAWADAQLKPTGGASPPASPRSAAPGNPSSPPTGRGAAGGPPLSPGRSPASRAAPEDPSKGKGWQKGQPRPGETHGPGKNYKIVPPNQLPPPAPPAPYFWPLLRPSPGPRQFELPPLEFPWKDLKLWMAPQVAVDEASRAHAIADPSKPEYGRALDRILDVAPFFGKATRASIEEAVGVARKDPSALKRVLVSAAADPSKKITFREPNLLPEPTAEPPFPWPKLRRWVQESVVAAVAELQEVLQPYKNGKDTLPQDVRAFVEGGLEAIHDGLAPRLGLESAEKIRSLCQDAYRALAQPKTDFDAVRAALANIRGESGLSDKEAAQVEAARRWRDAGDLGALVQGAIAAAQELLPSHAFRVRDAGYKLLELAATNADEESLLDGGKRLCQVLAELAALLRLQGDAAGAARAEELAKRLIGEAAALRSKKPVGATSPRGGGGGGGGGFEGAQQRAEDLKKLALPPAVKGQRLLTEESPLVQDTRAVGEAARRLAAAARGGAAEELIAASKDLHAICNKLKKQVEQLISGAKDKDTLDRLHSIRRALGTFPMQIKILSSVKAASAAKDFDKNDQLASMLDSLTSAVADLVPTVNTLILTN